jgi:hypothetical protein
MQLVVPLLHQVDDHGWAPVPAQQIIEMFASGQAKRILKTQCNIGGLMPISLNCSGLT